MEQNNLYCKASERSAQDREKQVSRSLHWLETARTFDSVIAAAYNTATRDPIGAVMIACEVYDVLKSPKYNKRRKMLDTNYYIKPKYSMDLTQRDIMKPGENVHCEWDDDVYSN